MSEYQESALDRLFKKATNEDTGVSDYTIDELMVEDNDTFVRNMSDEALNTLNEKINSLQDEIDENDAKTLFADEEDDFLKPEKVEFEEEQPKEEELTEELLEEELEVPENMGEIIRELRTKKGISQTKLANLVGVSQPKIYQVENNNRITVEEYNRYLEILNSFESKGDEEEELEKPKTQKEQPTQTNTNITTVNNDVNGFFNSLVEELLVEAQNSKLTIKNFTDEQMSFIYDYIRQKLN